MGKGVKGIGITAVVALVTFILVLAFFGGMRRTEPTVVAARPLAAGTKLTAQDVRVVYIHRSARLPGAFADPAEVEGKVLAIARAAGDQITAEMVAEGAYGLPAQIAADARAVAVHVNRASGVLGLLRPGDRVTVIGILDPAEFGLNQTFGIPGEEGAMPATGTVARVLLSGLRVLVVPQDFRYEETSSDVLMPVTARRDESVVVLEAPVTPITFTVTVQDTMTDTMQISPVELLALLDARGEVYLALEPLEGGVTASIGVSAADILNAVLHAPPVLSTPAPTPTPVPARGGRPAMPATPTPTPEAGEAKGG